MEPGNIDWRNIESIFVEDGKYESFAAPKWVDLSVPDEFVDDEAWFCRPDCKHPKSAEDFFQSSSHSLKGRLLRSLSLSEILPLKERNCRNVKQKGIEINPPCAAAELPNKKTENSKYAYNFHEEGENKNPNISAPHCKSKSMRAAMTPSIEKKKLWDEPSQDSSKRDGKPPQLKVSLSASNLLGRQQILNKISELCNELKNLAKSRSRKETSKINSGGLKETARERMPLIVREGKA